MRRKSPARIYRQQGQRGESYSRARGKCRRPGHGICCPSRPSCPYCPCPRHITPRNWGSRPLVKTIEWNDGDVVMIDQRALPDEEIYLACKNTDEVADAIRTLAVRGAPAIGIAAAYGLAQAVVRGPDDPAKLRETFDAAAALLASTRPTAVNLFWAIERMTRRYAGTIGDGPDAAREALIDEARAIHEEDIAACRRMGAFGAKFVPDGATILTYCNAGALATGGYGTALGVVRAAAEAGKKVRVFACETRPLLQGARLTAFELAADGIDVTIIPDNAAGHIMSRGGVDLVVTGADRIAANGDVANKIGTYTVAVLARENGVPFYVAAPLSTIDPATKGGADIPIEERAQDEVTNVRGRLVIAPKGVAARNPAFDVTPARFVRAIFTERGVAEPPSEASIRKLVETS
ncbi:S-methyl-5-thioribose-1-phosphate isomerase [bacterium]|nr:S-methyl-5-thioribose-1-phosphate isomerase [bacterium]